MIKIVVAILIRGSAMAFIPVRLSQKFSSTPIMRHSHSVSKIPPEQPPSNPLSDGKADPTIDNVAQSPLIRTNTARFPIGTKDFLRPLFSFYKKTDDWHLNDDLSLKNIDDAYEDEALKKNIEHCFTKSMNRDGFHGSWAHVWSSKSSPDNYHLKVTSTQPSSDVTPYAQIIPDYLTIISHAERACTARWVDLPPCLLQKFSEGGLRFVPPFGLPMMTSRSVLLMHYPPNETTDYLDYLYSRTTTRWETLLIANELSGGEILRYMSIVDICPIAASGRIGGSRMVDEFCEPIKDELEKFVADMLNLLLSLNKNLNTTTSGRTKPLVALGYVVKRWLIENKEIKEQIIRTYKHRQDQRLVDSPSSIRALDVFELEFIPGVTTPTLVMDHPSGYYRTPDTDKRWRMDRLRLDLVGARWQMLMGENPGLDPLNVLEEAKNYWKEGGPKEEKFQRFFVDHEEEFRTITSGTEP